MYADSLRLGPFQLFCGDSFLRRCSNVSLAMGCHESNTSCWHVVTLTTMSQDSQDIHSTATAIQCVR